MIYCHDVLAKILKDKKDREIILRNAEEDDDEKLIDYLKITAAETPFLFCEPDEIILSIKQEQDFIKTKKESKDEILLIAEMGDKHIGNCSLMNIGGYKDIGIDVILRLRVTNLRLLYMRNLD